MDEADRAALAAALDTDDVDAVVEQFQRRSHGGTEFWALPDYRQGLEKGTAVVDGEVVRGYPSTPRTLVLDPGVPEYFDGAATVEEKLNGYNVRIAALPAFDGPVAFTRGGYVCPYTTARAREQLDVAEFFQTHPDLVVCGELVGPENPYTAHDYAEVDSDALYVFDLRDRRTSEPLAVERRRELCRTHGFPQPEQFGTASGETLLATVREAIDDLDGRGREGVVLKALDGGSQLKYTTGANNRAELAHAFALPFDYGQDFLFSRVLREGFQAAEVDADDGALQERAHDLGEAILLPMVEAIRTVDEGGSLGEDHTVRGPPGAVGDLLAHLEDQGLRIEIHSDEHEDGRRIVRFRKVTPASTDSIRAYLDGRTVDE